MAKKTKYEVVEAFRDLQDGNKTYREGDSYPNPANKKIDDARLKELSGKSNKRGRAVIKEVTETE